MKPASESMVHIKTSELNLDEELRQMAHLPMSTVVHLNEFGIPRIGTRNSIQNAKEWLAAQMFTDAVFNQDIRVISTIINRIDGGLPKDTDVDNYQTLFGDCMRAVLEMTKPEQMVVTPADSVMMALCKSLYDIAIQDIYHDYEKVVIVKGKKTIANRKPSTEQKQARDAALRMVLERAGGRKTTALVNAQKDDVEVADWIQKSLPQTE